MSAEWSLEDVAEMAKGIVVHAFRNGPLEDLHAGKEACGGDASRSHITQDEMRTLMKYAVNKVYEVLEFLAVDPDGCHDALIFRARAFASQWDDPDGLILARLAV